MVILRPFESKDKNIIQDIERLCPQGDDKCAMGVFKPEGVESRYDLYDNSHLIVAEKDDQVVGWIGWTKKQDQKENYIYLAEVNVHPDYQGQGIATQLVDEIEKNIQESDPDHIYCYIYEPNKASKALFSSLGYNKLLDINSAAISTHKRLELSEDYQIKPLTSHNILETINLINNYYSGWKHFQPYSEESFQTTINNFCSSGKGNFNLVKQGNDIVACGGLWDCSNYAEFCFTKQPFSWKIMKGIYDIIQHFMRSPFIPSEGEFFNMYMIFDHAFNTSNPQAIQSLISEYNNQLITEDKSYLLVTLDPQDPLLAELKPFNPMVEKWSLHAKSFKGSLQKEQFYIDVRDLIP
ncbi:MAG: GNAT family N-acetyltransferase [Methanobacterium sp.]|nr:GNAT family N-acetyltransferase [Methanobacterium sp.]